MLSKRAIAEDQAWIAGPDILALAVPAIRKQNAERRTADGRTHEFWRDVRRTAKRRYDDDDDDDLPIRYG